MLKTLRKHLAGHEIQKFADSMSAKAEETCNWIGESNVMLTFVGSAWICRCSVPTPEYYCCKENIVIFKEGRLW